MASTMNASYVECSSKEMRGVDSVFQLAVDTVVSVEDQNWDSQVPSSSGKPSKSNNGGSGGGRKKIKKRSCKIL